MGKDIQNRIVRHLITQYSSNLHQKGNPYEEGVVRRKEFRRPIQQLQIFAHSLDYGLLC